MARSHSKLSIRRAQPAQRFVSTVATRKAKPDRLGIAKSHKISRLHQLKGKTLEAVEFISAPEYKGISLSFRDKTFLDLKIEASFTVKADYVDQKTGRHRVLKRWPSLLRKR